MVVIRTRIIQFMCRVEDPGSKMENKTFILTCNYYHANLFHFNRKIKIDFVPIKEPQSYVILSH